MCEWENGVAFGIQMTWREPADHVKDCYLVTTQGFNAKNKSKIEYPKLSSAN